MITYCFDNEPMSDFRSLCARFRGQRLQSPYRSTVPLLSLVQHNQRDWYSLLDPNGAVQGATVYFEYCVASPKPGGNPSQTDAVVMSDSTVWAVEAKWTESRYETVAKRLSKPETDGADPRITVAGWLGYLKPFANRDLLVDDFSDVVYQTLHRAASACAIATAQKRKPQLIYLHFHPSPRRDTASTTQYVADLKHLHTILGSPAGLIFRVVDILLHPTPAFEAIKTLDKRSVSTSAQVVEALCSEPLFTFGAPVNRLI